MNVRTLRSSFEHDGWFSGAALRIGLLRFAGRQQLRASLQVVLSRAVLGAFGICVGVARHALVSGLPNFFCRFCASALLQD